MAHLRNDGAGALTTLAADDAVPWKAMSDAVEPHALVSASGTYCSRLSTIVSAPGDYCPGGGRRCQELKHAA